jgi:uncharacterized protein (TIGR00251 family)
LTLKLTEEGGGVRFSVKAVPGASRDRIVGELGDALKVAVSAPAEGGKANRAIVSLLADRLGVAESQVSIVRGQSHPRKEVFVAGITARRAGERLGGGDDG